MDKLSRFHKGLVLGHLERISSKVFEGYLSELTQLIGKRHGVYALYKGNRLYYVGLATNLKSRIKHHLRDRHAKKWDKFSLYLVTRVHHIKELESLVLRIAEPRGNRTHGALSSAVNLRRQLDANIAQKQKRERQDIMGLKRIAQAKFGKFKKPIKNIGHRAAILAPYTKAGFKVTATYKGKKYTARVRSNGKINVNGAVFNSPSYAAQAVTGRPTDGWWFWHYRNKKGEWVRLRELRKSVKLKA